MHGDTSNIPKTHTYIYTYICNCKINVFLNGIEIIYKWVWFYPNMMLAKKTTTTIYTFESHNKLHDQKNSFAIWSSTYTNSFSVRDHQIFIVILVIQCRSNKLFSCNLVFLFHFEFPNRLIVIILIFSINNYSTSYCYIFDWIKQIEQKNRPSLYQIKPLMILK